ncbi:AbiTii domain-containing protein [Micromonospora sp. NPDC004704]
MARDRQAEARSLAEELLADIELSRLGAEPILLKSVRLARLISDDSSLQWLELELHGYEFTDETTPMLERMHRIIDNGGARDKAHIISLGAVEVAIRTEEARIGSLKVGSLSGEYLGLALDRVHNQINGASANLMTLGRIRSAVLAQIHEFAARTYYALTFGEEQEELFRTARRDIDGMLAPVSDRALERIESIVERLGKGEQEAISQAMNTCRRLIDSFADAVYPPRSEPAVVDGQAIALDKGKVLNRIDAYVRQYTTSGSRQRRLRQAIRGIYERVSAGVHDDVTPTEARFLFLESYVVLGEILALAPHVEDTVTPSA